MNGVSESERTTRGVYTNVGTNGRHPVELPVAYLRDICERGPRLYGRAAHARVHGPVDGLFLNRGQLPHTGQRERERAKRGPSASGRFRARFGTFPAHIHRQGVRAR